MMAITVLSIFGITIGMFLVRRFLGVRVCPICAGVSATWLWMVIAYYLGVSIDPIIPAILMGGSVVGIAYQGEKRNIGKNNLIARSPLLWKTVFLIIGFSAVYSFWQSKLLASGIEVVLAGIAYLVFTGKRGSSPAPQAATEHEKQVHDIEEKMKNCC